MLYLLSFLVLLFAELCTTLHALYAVRGSKHGIALFGAISTALWCIKIVVVVNQPLTIITAFLGAYVGSIIAFDIHKKLTK
jgi:hypothetical protein